MNNWITEHKATIYFNSNYRMSKSKQNRQPLSSRLNSQSPDKRLTKKDMNLSPQKLSESLLVKEPGLGKKAQLQKKRLRQLQTLSTCQAERVKQLQLQVQTVRKSLLLQVEMYKQMLREQQDDKARHVKTLQTSYNSELKRLLSEQEQEQKGFKAEKEDLERKFKELVERNQELDKKVTYQTAQNHRLAQHLDNTKGELRNFEEKLAAEEEKSKKKKVEMETEIKILKTELQKRVEENQRLEETVGKEKVKEVQELKNQYQTKIQNMQEKHDMEILSKSNQIKDLMKVFQEEGKRLQDIICNKERQGNSFGIEFNKLKEDISIINKHLHQTLDINNTLQIEIKILKQQKEQTIEKFKQLEFELTGIESKHELSIAALKSQATKQNVELIRENNRLLKQNQRLKRQNTQNHKGLSHIRNESRSLHNQIQADANKITAVSNELAEQNRHLRQQIRNLKEVLLESSVEMENCRQELIRLTRDRERLQKIARTHEEQSLRAKAILAQKDLQMRQQNREHLSSRPRY